LEDDGTYRVGSEVEKMSKRWYNVVNPDDICNDYGADTLRMYEMFLGPLEQSKPWNTAGISGVHNFLKKFWRLFYQNGQVVVGDASATKAELKILHTAIKKIGEDIQNYSFNTSVSAFMICVNELNDLKCHKREILDPLVRLLSPFAPHIAEELWAALGNSGSISGADWPLHRPEYLVEDSKEYPIMFNGKLRFKKEYPLDMNQQSITEDIRKDERTEKYLEGKEPKKIIVVPGKIVNIVY
jgi:leucyl-tRNA synthetase